MAGEGGVSHGRKHDIANPNDHKGDIYAALIGALNALTAANVAVDTKTLNDAIAAAIVGMQWQPPIIRFEAMVTSEPATPSDGDRYISTEVGNIPSTTQAVLVDDVCEWDTGTSLWIVTTPLDGFAVIEQGVDPNIAWWYSGAAWRKLGTIVDHANLLHLNWSVAAHVIDVDFDLNTHKAINMTDGALSTDGINLSQISFPKQSAVYHVSDSRGNDSNDGSVFRPLKTRLKAIQLGVTAGFDEIFVKVDMSSGVYTADLTLPDNAIVNMSSYGGFFNIGISMGDIIMGDGCSFTIDNISMGLIKEGAGWTTENADVQIENCSVEGVKKSDGTTPSTNISAVTAGTLDGSTLCADLKAMKLAGIWTGTIFDGISILVSSDGFDASGEKVIHQKDGTASDDSMAFGQRYADSEARAAIGDLLDSTGEMLKSLNTNSHSIYHDNGDIYISAGCHYDPIGLQWLADNGVGAGTASIIYLSLTGVYQQFYDTGLTDGVAFVPTQIYEIAANGDITTTGHIDIATNWIKNAGKVNDFQPDVITCASFKPSLADVSAWAPGDWGIAKAKTPSGATEDLLNYFIVHKYLSGTDKIRWGWLSSDPIVGREIHVSQYGLTESEGGDGSEEHPFDSIANAYLYAVAQSWSTVTIRLLTDSWYSYGNFTIPTGMTTFFIGDGLYDTAIGNVTLPGDGSTQTSFNNVYVSSINCANGAGNIQLLGGFLAIVTNAGSATLNCVGGETSFDAEAAFATVAGYWYDNISSNFKVSGTIEGRDISTDGTKLDTYRADVTLAGATPDYVNDNFGTIWNDGDRGHGIGTGGEEYYIVRRGTAIKAVEMA